MSLEDYGWSDVFAELLRRLGTPDLCPGRIVFESRGVLDVYTERGEARASLAGRLRHAPANSTGRPVVGDWVALRAPGGDAAKRRIESILPRKSQLSRRAAGARDEEQVVAANVDTVFIVAGLDADFNLRRIERMLVMTRESGARPVVLLNKQDICPDTAEKLEQAKAIAPDVTVLPLSCSSNRGLGDVRDLVGAGETIALVGSSGVGKSTLINVLMGEQLAKTRDVRTSDGRGRHTTTHRALFLLPEGGLLIDNPGIRELRLWSGEEAVEQAFQDVEQIAENCRFRDCTHESEPGCAVTAAVAQGTLERDRLLSFHRLQSEVRHLKVKQDEGAQRAQNQKWRAVHRELRKINKNRR